MSNIPVIQVAQARSFLIRHLLLDRFQRKTGIAAASDVLNKLRCIQIDPLDPMGSNPDLVLSARVNRLTRSEWTNLCGEHAFEHYSKERCLIPASTFPQYRDNHIHTRWWRHRERQAKLGSTVIEAVFQEIVERGPIRAQDLKSHGETNPIDWSGWKGTKRITVLAVEYLWIMSRIVVGKRGKRDKYFDIPSRAMPDSHHLPSQEYLSWAVSDRVQAAGLLAELAGPTWSTIDKLRKSTLIDQLIESKQLQRIKIEGDHRTYLAPADADFNPLLTCDDHMRILAPLDALLWDRRLVEILFAFDYVWEVYKPPAKRRWGWYVQPLLHRGKMVGRLEGKVQNRQLVIENLWVEGEKFDDNAFEQTLLRHSQFCDCDSFVVKNRIKV